MTGTGFLKRKSTRSIPGLRRMASKPQAGASCITRLLTTSRFTLTFCPSPISETIQSDSPSDETGSIFDVVPGTPAYEAGLGPNMTILSVEGRVYAPEALNDVIAHQQNGKIFVTVRNFNSVEVHEISYPGGVRFPHLERIPGAHDTL